LIDEIGEEVKELQKVADRSAGVTSQEVKELGTRMANMELSTKSYENQIGSLATKVASQETELRGTHSRLDQALLETSSLNQKFTALSTLLATSTSKIDRIETVEQSLAVCQKDFRELYKTLARANEEETQRRREDREEMTRLQQANQERDVEMRKMGSFIKGMEEKMDKANERLNQVEAALQKQTLTSTFLAKNLDALLRNTEPKTEAFFRQTEGKIKAEFLPDLLHRILRRQEDNVYARVMPNVEGIMQFVEDLKRATDQFPPKGLSNGNGEGRS